MKVLKFLQFLQFFLQKNTDTKREYIIQQAMLFIKQEEGCVIDKKNNRHIPYYCTANKLTVGYGTLIHGNQALLQKYTHGMSEEEAELELKKYVEESYNKLTKVHKNLKENELVALLTLVYNTGFTAYSKTHLCRMINGNSSSKYKSIKDAWLDWSQPKRRKKEYAVYSKGVFEFKKPFNMYNILKKQGKLLKVF